MGLQTCRLERGALQGVAHQLPIHLDPSVHTSKENTSQLSHLKEAHMYCADDVSTRPSPGQHNLYIYNSVTTNLYDKGSS